MNIDVPGRILSIQSHVAFGYVGGKAAVFPLQCLGYDVDVVNTVNFSNHSGYGRLGGTKANAAELTAQFDNMEQNGLLVTRRLLTGYIPGAEALSAVFAFAKKLKERQHDLIYLLDPVMGDAGRLYVAPDVVPVYRAMLPLATVITPNWYEVEVLTGTEIKDMHSLRSVLRIFHEEYHVPNVVISSMPLKPWLLAALPPHLRPAGDGEYLLCVASTTDSAPSAVHVECVPFINGYFTGVGDLFSALLLAHFQQPLPESSPEPESAQTPLSYAAHLALNKTHAILRLTHEHAMRLPEEERLPTDEEMDRAEPVRKYRRMRGRELRVVQGQDIIRGGVAGDRQMHLWSDFWTRNIE
ncbi:hypothetical protein PLICRDRAFT_144818 [Plicaturopsis crispa FD-325 SS-3]|nr:hypothetical protein PLICRDRAFT_144818 [Plicaturopsis crispa FD-325 SS-3]